MPHAATVLVVDDNEANRTLAQHTLEDEGYRVLLANGGLEAIAAFEQHTPDCILLDVRMPGIDGFAVCERIRALPAGAETPVIFLTAQRDVDTFDHAQRAGGDDFLTKPVRPSELIVRVQTALKLRALRSELREHYELLRQQRDALVRVQLQKERLMAFLVHDLKNPVSAMDLHAQSLLRDKTLSPAAFQSATRIRSEARHLTRMIVNLLDISKADEGSLTAKRTLVELAPLIDEIILELELNAKSRSVSFSTQIVSTTAVLDADLMQRTFTNLIENAIRHAPQKSAVSICAAVKADAFYFTVADAGRGVPDDMRSRIFDPFVQVENADIANRTGRGLGLAFCLRAVEAQGGQIWVEDAKPGARFVLRIPQ